MFRHGCGDKTLNYTRVPFCTNYQLPCLSLSLRDVLVSSSFLDVLCLDDCFLITYGIISPFSVLKDLKQQHIFY
jgi:hypothetical protein